MDNQVHNQIVSFIWGIADDCLRDVYVRGKYRDVILPMTVIRRLDAMLEETKPAVLAMKKQLDAAKIDNQWPALCNAAGQAFCNASPFLLKDLTSRSKAQTLKADFKAYLDGFSPNVQVILDKFKFRNQIDTMVDADILGAVIEKFTSSDINLSPSLTALKRRSFSDALVAACGKYNLEHCNTITNSAGRRVWGFMVDEWSGFAALLANLIEKYAVVLNLDALPDLVIEEAVPEKDGADEMIHENDIESAKAA